ncbi:MAG TPA: FG-GAP-like repeat-containing protein, partial [Candidatus Krumholzibacteria bacterium]|nr:FG-GAP-like repeat-containing protein [Candidatus Krumholzibacteria bacterium]
SYETSALFPGSVPESRAIAIDSLEAGYNTVFHVGHGYRFNMHCADDNIAIPDADALVHPGREFNLYMLNCTAAAFDFDCLGEHMLRNPNGGAVSIIGAANSAFAEAAATYLASYAQALYETGKERIGDAFMQSRVGRTPLALLGDGVDLWTHYVYAILADPAMTLWTGPIRTPTVTLPDSLLAGANDVTVQVEVSGLPEENATVCLWKDGEDYAVGTTDPAGSLTVPFTSAMPGAIRVVVTGRNMARYEAWIPVSAGTGALLVVDSVTLDDDNTGASSGNGDGRTDAGETIEVRPVFRNVGDATSLAAASALACTLSSVTITSGVLALPAIDANATWSPSGATWTLQAAASAADGVLAQFDIETSHGSSTWRDGFSTVLRAPALEITSLRKSDELPVGNGDGVITPGENFLLFVAVKNYGGGPARALTGSLIPLDGGSVVTTGAVAYPDLALLEESESSTGFVLHEVDTTIENPLQLTITDHEGRTLTRTIEMRAPAAPSIFSFDATVGIDKMKVTWSPGASPDVAGYRVYFSDAPGGPFLMATPDIVPHRVFTVLGLSANSRYYFAVAALDSSGNESPFSAIATASTNPPQYPGWPNELPDPSANSPAIGDVDGDGYPEIVIGNEKLYAWHHGGDEVRDGDALPATFGIFSSAGTDFIGPAALVDIDASPGLEIVAAAYTSREVFIFKGDGTVLPGWPQPTVDLVRGSVAVGDVDGDGDWEVVAVDQDAYLYVWHADGSELMDGDANPATSGVFKRLPDTNQWQYQAPALADLDNDGRDEIIIATQDKKVYVFNEDGSDLTGWPRTLPNFAGGGVVVGDIDDDGDLELVVTVRGTGETYALHHDNTVMWTRWLQHNLFFNPCPALADITGDGKLEVLIPSSNGRLYAVQYNGADAPGWPVTYSTKTYSESSPIIADVTGDGVVDVLLGHEEKLINGWSALGEPLDGFPLVVKDALRGAPAVVDLDINGDVEIVAVGYDKTVYVWDLTTTYDPNQAPWPMLRGNIHRNGVHNSAVATGVPGKPGAPVVKATLAQNYPNPFNPATTIRFELPAGRHRVSLSIYDVTGARVRTLVDGTLPGGAHSATWDGRNNAGSPVGSGVYFYRLSTVGRAETRKMVLLK